MTSNPQWWAEFEREEVKRAERLDHIRETMRRRAARECTCRPRQPRSTDVDPPEGRILDPWCPVHGKDPDDERDKQIEREWDRHDRDEDF